MTNRLIDETSPYLLQHADNPVDWYPWGDEALEKAKEEDKPIFLSIGYSACHWCHVMAHESFEDEETAQLLNETFVSIKVDREERPDLDSIYMRAVQGMTGRGGWPMSVFLTPEGQPFYGGTYFPPTRRYGMPSFRDVLQAVADGWQRRRSELVHSGQQLTEVLERQGQLATGADGYELSPNTLRSAVNNLWDDFDHRRGGWGKGPKFPQPMVLESLLRHHHWTGEQLALEMVDKTLEAMARGGMYDQLGGGFHRYSVDDRWLVPHFEKMLYDNAQLARVYLHAWLVTGEELFRSVAQETLDYVDHEMTDPSGGFYSAQDADSEGEEGKFFVWTADEIENILGDEAKRFMKAYGVQPGGNWEGKNILHFVGDLDQRATLLDDRCQLLAARRARVQPGRDEKVLTAWNGLMLAAFAEAARSVRGDKSSGALAARYRGIAERNADFLLRELRTDDGRLLHTWKHRPERGEGAGTAKQNGFLEDYTHLIEGLLELYQTSFDQRWFIAARELAETMIAHFQAPDGGFFDTSDDHEELIVRPRELQDNATPSGNAMAVTVLLKLAGLTNDVRYLDIAHQALAAMQPLMAEHPVGFGQWLQALSFALSKPREIAIIGDRAGADTRALLRAAQDGYRPFQVVAFRAPEGDDVEVPLLRDRGLVDARAAAYVCRDFVCQAPATEPEALLQALKGS